jgi:hypothetical protein
MESQEDRDKLVNLSMSLVMIVISHHVNLSEKRLMSKGNVLAHPVPLASVYDSTNL